MLQSLALSSCLVGSSSSCNFIDLHIIPTFFVTVRLRSFRTLQIYHLTQTCDFLVVVILHDHGVSAAAARLAISCDGVVQLLVPVLVMDVSHRRV